MTREELKKIARCYAQDELKDNHSAVEDVVASAFIDGVNYADSHPHWISVEDELPKDGEYVLICNKRGLMTTSLYENEEWVISETYLAVDVTHWMPMPAPPTCSVFPNKSKEGGEE